MNECHTFGKMSQCNTTFDLKINLGHSNLYLMVQWFPSFIFCSEKHFSFIGKARFRRATLSCDSSYLTYYGNLFHHRSYENKSVLDKTDRKLCKCWHRKFIHSFIHYISHGDCYLFTESLGVLSSHSPPLSKYQSTVPFKCPDLSWLSASICAYFWHNGSSAMEFPAVQYKPISR